ncbi:exodeoxyribonuclease III [Sporosarcina sp. P21c]|uniref:exodeoxyribonuclease III n=1 Tax=Sporosarcina TaxID=1569 RepID=UPI000A15EE84|nr:MULTISPECIES: exodeoxyribonuclease III [Sporosarcina]ARJ40140.1 exodeoxyribonuclease III [Sporosarcina ureae]PIC68662.1 exodeoxyribonuclease III [Sporosarcina sp. P16a]PIC84566.1 exodeoxyribonuclease III [Sporosarcina sp. P1]PIC91152.1 exodeoxyribonuclease III [Sporosarcina sp. P21c]PIC93715.1 exodeoxyribonuclease III [Sporosarcina sp. P25]
MKVVSWNVNGIRACVKKGFSDFFEQVQADIFCIQEIKCQEGQIDLSFEGYESYWNYAEKKGYSGTAVFTKKTPLSVRNGLNDLDHEAEGRVLTLEFEEFFLVNCYTPNSQRDLARLSFRLAWEDDLLEHLQSLNAIKPVIYCGDLNVAHEEIDIRNVKSNIGNSGFTYEERGKMTRLLDTGFIDTFRFMNPGLKESYTWWSYMRDVRARNIGWRIDYIIISERLQSALKTTAIHSEIMGSDHCPISAELEI